MSIDKKVDDIANELVEYLTILAPLRELNKDSALKRTIVDKLNVLKNQVAEDQFQKDCRASCPDCHLEHTPVKSDTWKHYTETAQYPVVCNANGIRNQREQETRILNR